MRYVSGCLYFLIAILIFLVVVYIHLREKIILTKILDDLSIRESVFFNRWLDNDVKTQNSVSLDNKANEELLHCHIPTLTNLDDFFNYGRNKAVMSCENLIEIGGDERLLNGVYPYNAGSRVVCLDKIKKGDCTVLSFGISNDPSFDFGVYETSNCLVYMFDPTVRGSNFPLLPKMEFFTLGLSGKKEYLGNMANEPVMVDRYESILKMLNLTEKVIDYLKVDIEGYEINFLEDVLNSAPSILKNARQFGMEIHPGIHKPDESFREKVMPIWKIMHQLECLGFSLLSFVPNLYGVCSFEYNNRNVSGCFDIVYMQNMPIST